MQPLEKTLRNQLERTVKQARDVAEAAACAALGQLGVGEAAPFEHLREDDKALRRKLRVHGRQLGDEFLPSPSGRGVGGEGRVQTMNRLVEEVAYEHWHRMLFARFLAENDLLIYDGVAITLEECEELAPEEDAANGWELAARLAAKMLPQIFRQDSPVFQLHFAANHQLPLEKLLNDLPAEVFTAADSLGWVYQFWQAKKKDEVNAAERKIGARELPAVTQLFTEPYMVSFLLDNSLGAWWAAKKLSADFADVRRFKTEEEVRKHCSIPGVPLEYLRFVTSPLNPLSMNGEGTSSGHSVTAHNFVAPEKLEAARQFRKQPTPNEAEAWEWLRDRRMLGLKWRRQQVIEGFIADFYCAGHHLALEIDGGIHQTDEAIEYDQIRDNIFAQKGIKTLRVSNEDCTPGYLKAQIEKAVSSPLAIHGEGGRGGEVWTPAAGTFDGWPEQLADLKTLDPCCGSGHFLVAAFLMLVPMRMVLEQLSAQEAVNAVLRENIHGLELDQRCVELAAFALALTAWKYPNAGGYRVLPELNVACSGLSISAKKGEWLALAGDNTNLRIALEELYKQFKDAPVLGSLINPEASLGKGSLFELKWEEVGPLLTKALKNANDDESNELAVVAKGLSLAAHNLASKYSLVFTNVPYLARGKQNDDLAEFILNRYEIAKTDLAAVFMLRGIELLTRDGVISFVEPQNWLYQAYYRKFRKHLLDKHSILLNFSLGPGAFGEITGEVVKPALTIIGKKKTKADLLYTQDASEANGTIDKAEQLRFKTLAALEAKNIRTQKDHIISAESSGKQETLERFVNYYNGICSGDYSRFGRCFWEVQTLKNGPWRFQQTTSNVTSDFVGMTNIFFWEDGNGAFRDFVEERLGENRVSSWIRGFDAWGNKGIAVSPTGTITLSRYTGALFDDNTLVLIPKDGVELRAVLSHLFEVDYNAEVRKIDKALKVRGALVKVPFNYELSRSKAADQYPNGLPKPASFDPTQWIFHGHPCGSVTWDEEKKWTTHGRLRTDDSVLHVATARLLGYRWPAELDTNMELADEQREWVKRCEALSLTPALSQGERETSLVDDDGIVCIPPVRGEASASDRLLNLLAAAYNQLPSPSGRGAGGEGTWSNDTLAALLKSADHAGKTLETWLREKFFTQHCKLFQHRPFIWHIWDGLRDGFAALVNYHKLDAKLLETLIYTYLGDWISRQKQDIASGVDGAQERLAAAESLKKKLELILEGEAPFDIFVRWKPLEKQPIGWDPDLNDGVRLNIRPFLSVPDVGKKGAGVLRDKPNINWNKDRGKDVESAPWYHVFDGDRINDHHLSVKEKLAAREGKGGL